MVGRLFPLITLMSAAVLALPLSGPDHPVASISNITAHGGPATCKSTHFPTDELFYAGARAACSVWFHSADGDDLDVIVMSGNPAKSTAWLPAYDDQKDMPWVYILSIDNMGVPRNLPIQVTEDECVEKFSSILPQDGTNGPYCIVRGTDQKLFTGGKIQFNLKPIGAVVWEVRKKLGT